MRIRKMFIYIAWVAMVTVMGFSVTVFANGKEAPPGEISVPYKIMQMSDYQVFLKNWDETNNSVLYAMISTPAQFNELFHPAPIMGSSRPFSPDKSLYSKEKILVVGRVVLYPENVDKVFDVDRITERNSELSLHYRYNKPSSYAKWKGKICLAIRIPIRSYKKVHFFENGRKVGELNLVARQWLHPQRTPTPRSLHD